MLWRSLGLCQWRGCLQLRRHARLSLLLVRRRSQTGPAVSGGTGHDALEEIGGTVTDGGWGVMRRAAMLRLTWTTASLKLPRQASDILVISRSKGQQRILCARAGETNCAFSAVCVCSS